MSRCCSAYGVRIRCFENLQSTMLRMASSAAAVVVLLSTLGHDSVRAADISRTTILTFEFACDFRLPIGPGCLNGVMASDGHQYRIAIYWMEPAIFRESGSFLRHSDCIITADRLHCWIYPRGVSVAPTNTHIGSNPVSADSNTLESIMQSVLALHSRVTVENRGEEANLRTQGTIESSRGLARYAYDVVPTVTEANDVSSNTTLDAQILSAMSCGTEFSKEVHSSGTIIWRAHRPLSGRSVATVTVRRGADLPQNDPMAAFDPNTLGHWQLIPPMYRQYWAFDSRYSKLSELPDGYAANRELHEDVESYLKGSNVPAGLRWAMDRLSIKSALLTADMGRIQRSAENAIAGLCRDESSPRQRGLLELARISGQIQKQYPQDPQEWLRPLVRQVVKHAERNAQAYIAELMPVIRANKWLPYGTLLLEEASAQNLLHEEPLREAWLTLRAIRLAKEMEVADPCEPCPRVRRYMTRIADDPPKGPAAIDDIRHAIEEGLSRHCAPDVYRRLAQETICMLRVIAGEGPYCANVDRLTPSIQRFSQCYFAVYGDAEPISTVLATFLGLSFCDTSTAEDHEILITQFQSRCIEVQSQINIMLNSRSLGLLVSPADVNDMFRKRTDVFRCYVDDPLWPCFKFAWTPNEEARIATELDLRLTRSKEVLDDVSLKVKYGGASAMLKERLIYEISHIADELIAEAAFLRRPMYPGVACRYRGRLGFTARIEGPLYENGSRAKETFRAMKYFHVGHRLEELVRNERELVTVGREELNR